MNMRFTTIAALAALQAGSVLNATEFNMLFFDASGDVIGSGTYSFDPIPADTNTVFDDVSNLNWSFDLPDYEISISLASGDSSSRESTAQEGLYTTIIGSALQLRFFDNSGSYISHNDESALPLRTSVRFIEFSNSVEYIKDDVSLGIGTFETIPVPEPATYGLVVGILAFGAGFRRSSSHLR